MNELFQRPANYWLRHADRHKQSGDLVRAAVLQRHAVRAEPGSDAARMQYALTLRQLHCYEASSREAFSALAKHPEQAALYGLVGCNMIAMGMRREGLDALWLYMHADITASAPWHDEACDLAEAYDYPFHEKKRQARLEGLLNLSARCMARGDLDGAGRALKRSQQPPYQGSHARRDLMLAAYWLRRGNADRCVARMQHALEQNFFDVSLLASAAVLSRQMGSHRAARMLLIRAASLARTPADRQMVCHVADSLHMVFIAHAMLKRELQRRADRCPVLYDLCVCALKMGRLQEALCHIHLCREIDPDDIPSEALFARVMDWEQQDISPDALRHAAKSVSFLGVCTEQELAACMQPFWEAAEEGPQGLAEAIRQDDRLRRRLLFVQTLPVEWPLMLLDGVCRHLPENESEALLREVLMQHPADSAAKRYAMQTLYRMGAPAPYACWTPGRFLLVDPDRLYAPVPTFRQRFLTRFIHKLTRQCGQEIIPWALKVISRMTPAQQCRLIGDPWKVWPLAMAMRYHALCGLPPVQISIQALSTLRLEALQKALHTLHKFD